MNTYEILVSIEDAIEGFSDSEALGLVDMDGDLTTDGRHLAREIARAVEDNL